MGKLYPHQEQALKLTSGRNRVAYYLDMGLGKTFCATEKMIELNAEMNLIVKELDLAINYDKSTGTISIK